MLFSTAKKKRLWYFY